MFEINPWILLSQAVNFLILLYLLKRFLFKPVGAVIEKRRNDIKAIKAAAEKEAADAAKLKTDYEGRIAQINEIAEKISSEAIKKAESQCEDIIFEAREKAEKIVSETELSIFVERQAAWAKIRSDVVQVTADAAEKIIGESLKDEDLQHRIIDRSIEELENSNKETYEALRQGKEMEKARNRHKNVDKKPDSIKSEQDKS